MFTSTSTDSVQLAGLGNGECGYFVGWSGSNGFGILHRPSGVRAIYNLSLSVGAGGSETIKITLNSVTSSFTIAAGTNIRAAWDIGAQNYMQATGVGWEAFPYGNQIKFISRGVGPTTGTFSLSASGTTSGSFSQITAGVANVDNWLYQSNFNIDTINGSGSSGFRIDPTKLNVFKIDMQYLGAGATTFSVEEPNSGRFVHFHRVKYANTSTTPHLQDPSLPLGYAVGNLTGTSNITMRAASCSTFVQGIRRQTNQRRGITISKLNIGTTNVPILSLRIGTFFGNNVLRGKIVLTNIAITANGSSMSNFILLSNSNLGTAPNFTQLDSESIVYVDSSATTYNGGQQIYTAAASANYTATENLLAYDLTVQSGDTLTIIGAGSAATVDVIVALNWIEDVY